MIYTRQGHEFYVKKNSAFMHHGIKKIIHRCGKCDSELGYSPLLNEREVQMKIELIPNFPCIPSIHAGKN